MSAQRVRRRTQGQPISTRRAFMQQRAQSVVARVEVIGRIAQLVWRSAVSLLTTPLEWRALLYQMDQLVVRSFGIASATAVFVGIVMSIQFAFTLERFGAKDTIGRIVGLSEVRELAPSLTALVVGSRIAAGVAAELGSMMVTEQVDAIRALGANPVRKLVVPRLLAVTLGMPMLTAFALVLGVLSAMLISYTSFGVPMDYFLQSAINIVKMRDYVSGLGKTPVFGFLVALIGCFYGLETRGGTEGVGRSTTSAVVVTSVTVLLADAVLTRIFLSVID